MKRVALLALLAGCSGWPGLDPVDGSHDLDPRLGTEIARSIHSFRIGSAFLDDGLEVRERLFEVGRLGLFAGHAVLRGAQDLHRGCDGSTRHKVLKGQ